MRAHGADDGSRLPGIAKARNKHIRVTFRHGKKQPARGLRVEQHVRKVERHVIGDAHTGPEEITVAICSGRNKPHLCHLSCPCHNRNVGSVDARRHTARLSHLAAVAHEREARDVGACVQLKSASKFDRQLIQRNHRVRGDLDALVIEDAALMRRG